MKAARKPASRKQATHPPAPAPSPVLPQMDLQAVGAALEDAGYDVTVYDHVEGRREDVGGAWVIDIDPAGKVTFRATYPVTALQQTQVALDKRLVQRTDEQNRVMTATTQISGPADIPDTVKHLEAMARTPPV